MKGPPLHDPIRGRTIDYHWPKHSSVASPTLATSMTGGQSFIIIYIIYKIIIKLLMIDKCCKKQKLKIKEKYIIGYPAAIKIYITK